jgi:hypothetical protein
VQGHAVILCSFLRHLSAQTYEELAPWPDRIDRCTVAIVRQVAALHRFGRGLGIVREESFEFGVRWHVQPPNDTNPQEMDGSSEVGWQATFILGGGPTMGYRLTDETGTVVGEGHMKVDWIRIDGSEQCGGNRQATVELPV